MEGGGVWAGFYGAIEEGVGEERFLLLELVNAVFHSARADEFMDEDRLVLADAVGAVGGLVFGGGVPPGVEVDDAIGGGEVKASAARFK